MKTVYDRMMENDSYQKTKDFIIKQKWPYPQKKGLCRKNRLGVLPSPRCCRTVLCDRWRA